jgi:transposase-like protein
VTEKRKQYSPEFKEEAARLVVDFSRPIAHVAREIGVHEITLAAVHPRQPGADIASSRAGPVASHLVGFTP